MKIITVNGEQRMFLQYENECKQGNRILIYYSKRASQILALSTVLVRTFRLNIYFSS